ncbi:MAG: ATPase [Paenibacillus sp.]|nr:ATPase [Paenibacillus sp.]
MEASATNENKQMTFQITGMTCAACANRIEKGLGKLPGVTNASVNFAMETGNDLIASEVRPFASDSNNLPAVNIWSKPIRSIPLF